MTSTIIERRGYTAAGGDSATLKPILPSLGVSGVINRWESSMLSGADGAAVASWEPYRGTVPLVQSTGAAQPVVATVSGRKVLRFDGVDDTITSLSLTPAKAFTMLVRMTSAAGTTKGFAAWDGGTVSRGSTGTTSTVRTGAANLTQAVSIDQPLFHVVTIINDFSGSVGATVVDGLYGAQATDRENANIILGRGSVSSFGAIDVLSVAVLDHAPTADECQTIRTNYKAAYPGLVA